MEYIIPKPLRIGSAEEKEENLRLRIEFYSRSYYDYSHPGKSDYEMLTESIKHNRKKDYYTHRAQRLEYQKEAYKNPEKMEKSKENSRRQYRKLKGEEEN